MDGVHSNSILIMGPPHVGKGRISTILSEKTNMPLVSLASSREKYYSELNYDKEYAHKLKRENGELARYQYSKPFEAHHVVNFLNNLTEACVVKFEATQSVYEDQALFDSVFEAVKKFENIILILPDIDMLDSWKIINKLVKAPEDSDLSKLNWHLVSSRCNSNLATHTIYASGKTPEDMSEEILEHINSKTQKNVKVA